MMMETAFYHLMQEASRGKGRSICKMFANATKFNIPKEFFLDSWLFVAISAYC